MNIKNVIFRHLCSAHAMRILCIGVLVMTLAILPDGHTASAAESVSFQLYDSFPNVSNPAPDSSDSFLLNENGVTWIAQPVASTNFQIVTAPPVASSSASSAASSAAATSSVAADTPATGGHRGKRTPPARHPAAGRRSSSSSSVPPIAVSPPSSAGSSSAVSRAFLPAFSGSTVTELTSRLQPSHPSAACEGGRCACAPLWPFGGMCVAVSGSPWSWIGIVCVVIEVLLLLRIFHRRAFSCRRSR